MIEIKRTLAYGVDENINKDLLYIKTFKLSGNEKDIKWFLENLSNLGKKLYQYNVKDRKVDYDYFFWCNVENDKQNLSYITLDYNRNHSVVSIISEMIWMLWWLKGYTKKLDFTVTIVYDDINNLVKDIEERIKR